MQEAASLSYPHKNGCANARDGVHARGNNRRVTLPPRGNNLRANVRVLLRARADVRRLLPYVRGVP